MSKTIGVLFVQLILSVSVSAATYYVSPKGDNGNDGTSENKPFRVVQFAIDQMQEGDTLIVLDGIYTGTLHLKSGITIKAKSPRKVVFSGAEPLTVTFEKYTDKIYKARIDKEIKQLFFNQKPMIWAQWPNMSWEENWIENKKWAKAAKGTGPGVLTSKDFVQIADMDLVGAYCFLRYGKGNSCYSRLVKAFNKDTLYWNDDNFYTREYSGEDGPRGRPGAPATLDETHVYSPINSKFFLVGDINLLDAPGEWFVEGDLLYFYPPNDIHPNDANILVKTIDYSIIEEQAISNVSIEGIDFFCGAVKLGNVENRNINFRNVYFTYTGGELLFIDRVKGRAINKPIEIAGSKILFEECLFAGAQNTALSLSGSEVTVKQCVFIENNRHANFESRALALKATGNYKISHNTFFNNCSDAISISIDQGYNKPERPEVSYNNIFNAGKFNSDVSGIYMPVRSQKYAEVHHNWLHNIKGNAFRLDVAGKELNLHHNVLWASKRGMSVEGYGQFNIYNNTDVHNHVASDIIRNQLNHVGANEASQDSIFPVIDDWNVLNNIFGALTDAIGPREKSLYAARKRKGLVNIERATSDEIFNHHVRPLEGGLIVKNRGTIQGNIIAETDGLFKNGNLKGLNLIPIDNSVITGIKSNISLQEQGIDYLNSFSGAYEANGEYWYPGSNWMPYGLKIVKTLADAEAFAKKYYSISFIPEINMSDLPIGKLQ